MNISELALVLSAALHLCHFIQHHFLASQVARSNNELIKYSAALNRVLAENGIRPKFHLKRTEP